jgi:2-keto-4-pentenoate hydratase/2-oxohepta-3-ene-1,7-dioic acid hydratase in catechol pathway
MRIGSIGGRAVLVTSEDTAIDVHDGSGGRFDPDPLSLFECWEEVRSWAVDVPPGYGERLDAADLGAPVPRPRQVFAIGLNYRRHAEEVGAAIPDAPVVFTKFPTCLAGPIGSASVAGGLLDWETELVVVVGRHARDVPVSSAWDHVAGVSVGQDLSDRALQRSGPSPQQWSLAKSRPGYGPMGPVLVTVDELEDPDRIELGCAVNGIAVQSAATDDLIFSVPELIAYLSGQLTLLPGDLIFTGTPSGVAAGRVDTPWLQPGDVLTTWARGIGELQQRIVD